jgi:hypothetical protein
MAMGRTVLRHPAAAMLLGLPGKAETTHMWTDASTGLECKCRPDWLTDDGSIVVDLKTTKDASPRGFKQSVANYRYHVQAAWYLHGLEQATGKRPDQFIFICVESTAPYAVAVYAADAEMIERGTIRRCVIWRNWRFARPLITGLATASRSKRSACPVG